MYCRVCATEKQGRDRKGAENHGETEGDFRAGRIRLSQVLIQGPSYMTIICALKV